MHKGWKEHQQRRKKLQDWLLLQLNQHVKDLRKTNDNLNRVTLKIFYLRENKIHGSNAVTTTFDFCSNG